MNVSSTSSNSSMNITSSSNKRLSGLISGLDTDNLVKAMTADIQGKIDKTKQNRQKALWRQSSYREITKALSEFKDKYFSSSSSTSSVLNADFFSTTSIKNAYSAYLNVSGKASTARNMKINSISQLARQAAFTSTHDVSNQMIQTGVIQETWKANAVAGTSLTIKYGDTDYNVAVSSDFMFDATSAATKVEQIADSLNNSISKIDDLKGKISFKVSSGKIQVTKDLSAEDFSITDGSKDLLTGLGLTKGTTKASSFLSTGTDEDAFYQNEIPSGSKLTFELSGKEYTLKTSAAIKLSEMTGSDITALAKVLETSLADEIKANPDLKDKLSVSVGSDGKVSFTSTSGGSIKITGGSQNMLNGLGFTAGASGTGTLTSATAASRTELVTDHLVDSLAGSSLTFSLNGLQRTVIFNESETGSYSTPAALASYLQDKLATLYGKTSDGINNKVIVERTDVTNAGGTVIGQRINFKTTDPTSVLSVSSSDAVGVLGKSGALRVYAGESNRINTRKSLEDITANMATPLTPNGKSIPDGASVLDSFTMTVNGKDFTFKKSATLDDVLNTINNDAEANVTISYSSVTDNFTVAAKNGGANSKVEISDKTGNLAAALFGASGERTTTGGQDAILNMSFNGADPITITRSENKFSIDGVNFELLKDTTNGTPSNTTDDEINSSKPITFSAESNVDDLYKKISTFIDDYNTIITSLNTKITESKDKDEDYEPLTDDQKKEMTETQITNWEAKAKKGLMQSDSILSSLQTDFRGSMMNLVDSISSGLYQFGITSKEYDYSGKLVVNETKLKQALTDDPDKFALLFTGSDGIATRMQSTMEKYIGTFGGDGLLIQKAGQDNGTGADNSSITRMVSDYDKDIKTLKTRLENKQSQLYAKFTQLETYLSKMNTQSSWFSSNSSSQ